MNGEKKDKFKIVLLGGPAVGKSALTLRMITENFVKDYDPTIEDIYTKEIVLDGEPCVLMIVDTAGNEDFNVLIDNWIGEGDGFLLVYAINDEEGFKIVDNKHTRIIKVKESVQVPMILVASKCDLQDDRIISIQQGKDLAEKWKIPFIETSAKEKKNDEEVFYQMIRILRSAHTRKSPPSKKGEKRDKKVTKSKPKGEKKADNSSNKNKKKWYKCRIL